MHFLHGFQSGNIDLERLNRAHIILIPKHPGAFTPDAFRPISLQNFPIKVLTKMLTTQLQRQISELVDINRTGFIRGRSISENVVYSTELVQCCHQRKCLTSVLMLDFAKAFDSVSWASLILILRSRGFPDLWIQWMQRILSSSRSAVMVNGCPGP